MFGCGVFAWSCARLTIRSLFGKGSGRSSTELIAEKTALLAPIPSASVSTTVIENAGDFVNARNDTLAFRSVASSPRRYPSLSSFLQDAGMNAETAPFGAGTLRQLHHTNWYESRCWTAGL